MKAHLSNDYGTKLSSRSAAASHHYPDIKRWVAVACANESHRRYDPLWIDEPSSSAAYDQRRSRIKFLRKHRGSDSDALALADRLDACNPEELCLSGACPECGRLFQRWFVRRSEQCIDEFDRDGGIQLHAISIVPPKPLYALGRLHSLSITDFHRRLKYALKEVGIDAAIGGIDFALSEHKTDRFAPRWVAHHYIIVPTANPDKIRAALLARFPRSDRVPRPVKVPKFENISRRRSYALKMHFMRRISIDGSEATNDKPRVRRNTEDQRLRTSERLELWLYLDQIGLGTRPIFHGLKPIIGRNKVSIVKINRKSSYQAIASW